MVKYYGIDVKDILLVGAGVGVLYYFSTNALKGQATAITQGATEGFVSGLSNGVGDVYSGFSSLFSPKTKTPFSWSDYVASFIPTTPTKAVGGGGGGGFVSSPTPPSTNLLSGIKIFGGSTKNGKYGGTMPNYSSQDTAGSSALQVQISKGLDVFGGSKLGGEQAMSSLNNAINYALTRQPSSAPIGSGSISGTFGTGVYSTAKVGQVGTGVNAGYVYGGSGVWRKI